MLWDELDCTGYLQFLKARALFTSSPPDRRRDTWVNSPSEIISSQTLYHITANEATTKIVQSFMMEFESIILQGVYFEFEFW